MPWNNRRFIRECQDAVVYGRDDLLEGTAGEIRSSDTARKKCIASNQLFLWFEIQTDTSLRVTWGVKHLRFKRSSLHKIRVFWTVINLDCAWARHSQPGSLNIQHLQQSVIISVEQNGCTGRSAQFHRATHMINMGMSYHDLLNFEIVFI